MKKPSVICRAESLISRLVFAVHYAVNDQRIIEEHLFGVALRNAMFLGLAFIADVPFESFEAGRIQH